MAGKPFEKFSISLAVENIRRSKKFYESLGFEEVDGGHVSAEFPDTASAKWRILKNGEATIGLFVGMFESNLITLHEADSKRIKSQLEDNGFDVEEGPIIVDPDGNQILLE